MKLRCKTINGQRLCPLTDVARAAGVHRNSLYAQRRRLGVTDILGLAVIPRDRALGYIKAHAPVVARAKKGR